MIKMLTVVIPSYDLRPLLGPLGLLPELCNVIREHAVDAAIDEVKVHIGHTERMAAAICFEVAHDPPQASMKTILAMPYAHTRVEGFYAGVWVSAVMSPVYKIGDHIRDAMIGHETRPFFEFGAIIEDFVWLYIDRVERALAASKRPEDFHGEFNKLTIENIFAIAQESRRLREQSNNERAAIRAAVVAQQAIVDALRAELNAVRLAMRERSQ